MTTQKNILIPAHNNINSHCYLSSELTAKLLMKRAAVAISLAIAGEAQAATVTVSASCSLTNAIKSANADSAIGGCTAGNGNDVINLPSQTITLSSIDNTDPTIGANGLPVVSSEITIQGNGSTIQRNTNMGTDVFRVFSVYGNSAHLTLNDLTISHGSAVNKGGAIHTRDGANLTLIDSTITGNTAQDGGGIYITDGNMTLTNSTVSANSANGRGGGLHAYHPATVTINGGALSNNNAARMAGMFIEGDFSDVNATSVTISDAQVSNNTSTEATFAKGTIYSYYATLMMNSATLSNNHTANRGAAVHCYHSDLNISASQLSNNSAAGNGGAIFAQYCSMTITQSQLSNNSSSSLGGAIYAYETNSTISASTISANSAAGSGGGIYVYESNSTMNTLTISGNNATSSGGGVFVSFGSATLTSATLSNNNSGLNGGGVYAANANVNLYNSSVTDNSATNGGGMYLEVGNGHLAKIVGSSIELNSATQNGGGIANQDISALEISRSLISANTADRGAGLNTYSSQSVVISNSTFSSNSAVVTGGGIYAPSGDVTLANVTIYDNQSANTHGLYFTGSTLLAINNTVIAGSVGSDCNTSITAPPDNNWFGDNSCDGVADGNPKLGNLQDNGGATKTHEPLSGSGLIDQADVSICTSLPVNTEDQRGQTRSSAACDIGAVENSNDDTLFVIPIGNGKAAIVPL